MNLLNTRDRGATVLTALGIMAAASLNFAQAADEELVEISAENGSSQVESAGEGQSPGEIDADAPPRQSLREGSGRRGDRRTGVEGRPRSPRREGFGAQRDRPAARPGGPRRGRGPSSREPNGDSNQIFDLFDVDEDGQLSRDEFHRLAEVMRLLRGHGRLGGPADANPARERDFRPRGDGGRPSFGRPERGPRDGDSRRRRPPADFEDRTDDSSEDPLP